MKKIFIFVVFSFIFSLLTEKHVRAYTPQGNFVQMNGGHIIVPEITPVSSSAWSFEVWVKPETLSGQQKIVSIGNPDEKPFYELGINGGSLSFDYRYGSNSYVFITSGNVTAGSWNHLGAALDGAKLKLFINGSKVFEGNGANNLPPVKGKLVFGRSAYQFYQTPFKGDADSLRISGISLDIAKNWTDGVYDADLKPGQSTVLLWRFDSARGYGYSPDDSGNNLNGILVGGDKLIHYFGILPSPTPFSIRFPARTGWILPTLSFPERIITPIPVSPILQSITATPINDGTGFDRYSRPVFGR